jgi:hypothetical protein
MKQSSPAGFDHASHSEPEMLARLRNYKTANQIRNRLREIGLRTTRSRVALGNILFAKGNRHISAEMLFEEANQAKSRFHSQPFITLCISLPRPAFCDRSQSILRNLILILTTRNTIIIIWKMATS